MKRLEALNSKRLLQSSLSIISNQMSTSRCVLALKRNHDDPKAAAAFLENMKKGTANDQTPEDVADSVGEGWTRHWNSGSTSELDQRSKGEEVSTASV